MSLFFKKKKREEPAREEDELPEELEKFRVHEDVRESVPEEFRLKTDAPRESRAPQMPVREEPEEPLRPAREEPDDEKMDLVLSKLDAIESRLKLIERKMKA